MGLYKLMKRRLDTARTFSRHDWWTLGQAWLLLGMVDLALRVLPFRLVHKCMSLARRQTRKRDAAAELAATQHMQRLVSLASQCHLYPMRCLSQALVLQRLLGRQGIPTELRIGVRKEAGQLCAHAWLEYHGQPLGEPQGIAARFEPLAAPGVEP